MAANSTIIKIPPRAHGNCHGWDGNAENCCFLFDAEPIIDFILIPKLHVVIKLMLSCTLTDETPSSSLTLRMPAANFNHIRYFGRAPEERRIGYASDFYQSSAIRRCPRLTARAARTTDAALAQNENALPKNLNKHTMHRNSGASRFKCLTSEL